MGVPAFFRWLSRKYPSVIVECVENKTDDGTGQWIPEDATLPNPNGIEFDNLYLDMNGIIHPCTHPEDKPAPKNEDEMMVAIFECIDRLFNIVRPRKVLYMAIDGVAPRAKMNQQRSRRFRASKETVEKQLEVARIREKLISAGAAVPPEKPKGEHFDSNCITPGTPFMERLSKCLHYYIHDRLNSNPAWKNIKVFLSDANVPGEGEHKIMDFIRRQRAQPDHDPNTQHVLCGADADLIMLGLATHEPNFTIIREEFLPNKPRPCEICSQIGHEMDKCEGLIDSLGKPDIALGGQVQFIFVRLCVLKEYLKRTLDMPNLPFKYEFERVLDDWVFMCFFVGNDFLPHLPSLEIREGAIDRLIELYKKCVYKTSGYLTDSGEVNLDRVQMILRDLGFAEDEIFRQRQRRELSYRAREKMNKKQKRGDDHSHVNDSKFGAIPLGRDQQPAQLGNARQEMANFRMQGSGSSSTNWKVDGVNSKAALEAMIRPEDGKGGSGRKRKQDEVEQEEEEEDDPQKNDEVRLWEAGFKDRYYESKFDVGSDNIQFRSSVALQYIKGLCWVLKYYYQGCASWNWYFPYHYAPFASDFVNIGGLSTKFEKGTKPFNPLEQLMGVFPAASSSHVPKPWAKLMSDPESVIIDFYPEDFKIDLNGKKFAWQGVALLPFVDEKRLIKAVQPYYSLLTVEEIKRNQRGDDRMYVSASNPNYKKVYALYKNKSDADVELPILIDGVQGHILTADECVPKGSTLPSPIIGLHEIDENKVVTVRFRDPKYPEDFIFKAQRLPGAVDPPTVLAPENRSNDYRPQIGFNRNFPQASLGAAGHRMVNHHSNKNSDGQQRHYASIPPPQQQQYRGGGRNDNNSYNRGHNSGENNYQNRYQNNQNNFNYGGYNNRGGRGGGSGGGQFYGEQNRYNNRDDNNRYNQGGGNRGRGGGGGGGGRSGYQGNNSGGGFWRS